MGPKIVAFTPVVHDVQFERYVEHARISSIHDDRGVRWIVALSDGEPACRAGRQLDGDTNRRMLYQALVGSATPIVAVDRAEERPDGSFANNCCTNAGVMVPN